MELPPTDSSLTSISTVSGREFHRDAPEIVRLELNRLIQGLEMSVLVCS